MSTIKTPPPGEKEPIATTLDICNALFGNGASAEHLRLIEVIQDKMRFGNPTHLINLIESL